MRRWSMFLLLLAAFSMPLVVLAEDDGITMREMASFFPDVDVFAAIRTDAAHLDQLDAVMAKVTTAIPDDVVPRVTMRDLINQIVVPDQPLNVMDIVSTWVGNYAAVGIRGVEFLVDNDPANDARVVVYGAVSIRNRVLAEASLALSGFLKDTVRGVQGAYTTYTDSLSSQRTLGVSNDMLLFVVGPAELPVDLTVSLADNPDFDRSVRELPAQQYSFLVYENRSELLHELGRDAAIGELLAALGLDVNVLGPVSLGFIILDDRSLVLDVVQARPGYQLLSSRPVDMEFVQQIPANPSLFFHATDLSVLVNTISGLIASISASDTTEDVYGRFESLTKLLLGVDLQQDILAWTSGDYGAFVELNSRAMNSPQEGLPVEVGFVFEITELSKARTLATAIGDAVRQLADDSVEVGPMRLVVVADGEAKQVDVVNIQILDPNMGLVEIVIGVNDNLMFFATYDMAVEMLSRGPRLFDFSAYQEAQSYFLPNSSWSLFVNSQGPEELIVFGIAFIEPLRNLLFDDLTTPAALYSASDPISELLSSSSISVATSEAGSLMMRFVVTLTE